MSLFARFLADDDGATAIEYALIAVGISLAVIAGVTLIGSTLRDDVFAAIAAALP